MTTYQTQSRVGIIGTVPATIVGTIPTTVVSTVPATIIGTVPAEVRTGSIAVVGTIGPQTFLGTVGVIGTVVSQPFLGTVALVGTIATILSPITAQVTPTKRATITTHGISTVTTTMITLLNANPNRAEFYVRLIDLGTVFLGLAATVSSATFSVMLMDYEMYANDVYTGVVTAVSAAGNVRVVVHEI